MATKREQIMAAVATALASTAGTSGRVWRSRQEALARSESPAIIIEPGPAKAADESVSLCNIDWTFTLVIAVYARGTIPDQVADPVVADMHSKLFADRTLGGLAMDIWPLDRDPQFDKADQAALWEVCTYKIRFRTPVSSQ